MSRKIIYIAIDEENAEPDSPDYLASLKEERQLLEGVFRKKKLVDQNIDLYSEDSENLSEIVQDINAFSSYLCIFHYAGHANSNEIHLADKKVQGKNIAHLLSNSAESPNLKLVFLNGCSTNGQVKFFLEFPQNLAVIATHCPINDSKAKKFAHRFYGFLVDGKSIKEAFDNAIFPEIDGDKHIDEYTFRDLGDVEEEARFDSNNQWGLFCKYSPEDSSPENPLHWKLIGQDKKEETKGNQTPPLHPYLAYDCDRTGYDNYFQNYFKSSKRAYHYFILGEKQQNPDSLAKNLVYKLFIKKMENRNDFFYSDRLNNEMIEIDKNCSFDTIISAIYDTLSSDNLSNYINIDQLFNHALLKRKSHSFISLHVNINDWSFVKEAIEQFVTLSEKYKSNEGGKILFFWVIEYNQSVSDNLFGRFMRMLKDDKKWLTQSRPAFEVLSGLEAAKQLCLLNNKDLIAMRKKIIDLSSDEISNLLTLSLPIEEDLQKWIKEFNDQTVSITKQSKSFEEVEDKSLKDTESTFIHWIKEYNSILENFRK